LRQRTTSGLILVAEKEQYGQLMTLEMGKPLRAAIDEAVKCAWACRYYAEHGPAFLKPETIAGADNQIAFIVIDARSGERLKLANGDNHLVLATRLKVQ